MTRASRLYGKFVDWVCAHPRRAAIVLVIGCLPALALAVALFSEIHAGLEELLPPTAPSVRALKELHARLGGKSHLTVIIKSANPDANHRFVDALADKLKARHLPEARSIQGNVRVERAWLREHAALLMRQEQFDAIIDDLEQKLRSETAHANPLYVDLEDEPQTDWNTLQQRLQHDIGEVDRFPNGYLEMPDGRTVVMLVWLQGSEVELTPAERLMEAVREDVASLKPEFPPDLRVNYTGEVPNLIEEHDAIISDLSLSTLVVFVLVATLIIAYFRSARSVLVVFIGLVPGLIVSFGLGKLLIGHLNSNTAFLGSIIAGNGINYPLLFLAYYRTRDPTESMSCAIREAGRAAFPGTLGAALTASAAYGGLAASTFKGFAQFGWLGGTGMLATWACTFIATPIAIALLDPPRHGRESTQFQEHVLGYFAQRGKARKIAITILASVLVLAAFGVRNGFKSGIYEMSLQVLRNRESLESGSASWDHEMNELFGVWLNPVAALVNTPSEREMLATEARQVMTSGLSPVAERVETIEELVKPEAEQRNRIARLKGLERDLKRAENQENIPSSVQQLIRGAIEVANAPPVTAADLPPTLRQAFEEVDGRTDRVVLIYPSLKIDYDNGQNVLRFEERLQQLQLPPNAVIGGGFLFMAAIIRVIRDEAPRVVIIVGILVALVIAPIFRRKPMRIPIVVGTVAIVALLSQAMMLALGVRINMLNFAAVPITIGVGSDYFVNLFAAVDVFKTDVREACARMGGAILLCSLTTVVGYFSLVVAQSGALRTFGWAAVLGELLAAGAILLILPALLPWRSRHGEQCRR